MAKSKNRPKYKAKKKKANIHKQNLKQMANKAKNEPITFVYNKDKETVEVPIKMWQTLNQAAQQLQGIAVFVSTMETVGQLHMQDGTLLPVFQDDLEVGTQKNPDGSPQMKIKDSFWIRGNDKGAPVTVPPTTEEVIILQAEGKFQEETPTVEVVSSAQ
jgi:hypothetical protein